MDLTYVKQDGNRSQGFYWFPRNVKYSGLFLKRQEGILYLWKETSYLAW